MAVQSKLAKKNDQQAPIVGVKEFNNFIGSTLVKTKITQMVGATDAQEFITSVISAVNNTPALQECEANSIISAALLGQSFHLTPSPQLGYFYMVPFGDKNSDCKKAQFVMGYKGYLQLAMRTQEYIDIDAIEVREGEYKGRDKFTGRPQFEFIEDDDVRESLPVVGYMSFFEMKGGYIKRMYWSKEKMLKHADKYSPAFELNGKTIYTKKGPVQKVPYEEYIKGNYDPKTEWLYSSHWYQNFDEMAKKTMLRQLLSKYAYLSTSLQKAYEADNHVISEDLKPDLNIVEAVAEEIEETPVNQIEADIGLHAPENIEPELVQEPISFDDFDPMSM